MRSGRPSPTWPPVGVTSPFVLPAGPCHLQRTGLWIFSTPSFCPGAIEYTQRPAHLAGAKLVIRRR